MVSKKAFQTVGFSLSVGLVTLASALLSHGPYIRKAVPLATAIIFAGITAGLSLWQKGKKADQDCDEREQYIQSRSMKFTFFAMSYVITALWAYEVAQTGTYSNSTTLLLYGFWGSYILGYGFNKLRS